MKRKRPKRLPGFDDTKRRRRRISTFDLPHTDPRPRVTEYGDVDPTRIRKRTR